MRKTIMAVHACNQAMGNQPSNNDTLTILSLALERKARDPKSDPNKTESPKLKHICHRPPKDRHYQGRGINIFKFRLFVVMANTTPPTRLSLQAAASRSFPTQVCCCFCCVVASSFYAKRFNIGVIDLRVDSAAYPAELHGGAVTPSLSTSALLRCYCLQGRATAATSLPCG